MNSLILEQEYVYTTYNSISTQFDSSRFCMWPEVTKFLNLVKSGSLIADIGCGNGKYLDYRVNDCTIFACDISEELLKISKLKRNPKINYTQGSVLNLPYRDNLFDAIIHIAVLHHISTKERRIIAIKELIRCCCIGGRICITVWADEQIKKEILEGAPEDVFAPEIDLLAYDKTEIDSVTFDIRRKYDSLLREFGW